MRTAALCSAAVSLLWSLLGCGTPGPGAAMKAEDYQRRPTLTTSLFKSDQEVLGEDALARIMNSKIDLPDMAKVAVMRFAPDREGDRGHYGYYYWRNEAYLKTQQEYIDALEEALIESGKVVEVVIMPSLLTPKDAAISLLREAAVRLQADLLLVFTIASDTYYRDRWLESDEVKAFSTCEAVLLDVRTGTIPFTAIATKEKLDRKQKSDLEAGEAIRRAERLAVLDSLHEIGSSLSAFLNDVP